MTTYAGPDLDGVVGVGALTMGGFLEEVTQRFATNEALVLDDRLRGGETVRWTYAQLGTEARRVARALVAAGVAAGETVAIVMGNRPEAVAALFGAALAGAVAAPISTFAARPELAAMLARCEAVAVLTQARLLGRHFGDDVEHLRPGLASVRRVAVVGEPSWADLLTAGGPADGAAGGPADDRLRAIEDALLVRGAAVTPDDPALVIFSSGTTAEPKAVLHAHRSPALQFWLQAAIFGRDERTRMYTALPLFWSAGLDTAMGSTLAAGGCWVMQESFEPGEALRLMAREQVTEPYTLPHQTAALAEHPDWPGTDLSSLRCVYGKSAYAHHPSVHGDPGWIMPVGYGLSETSAFVSSHRSDATRAEAKVGNGRLLAGTRLRVVDPDTGRVLDVGEEGELLVAGATLMLRYLGRAPEDCIDADGFFRTGDAGFVDRDGIVHYSGRRTEMIKTGGANVSPAEVEVQLRGCAPVKLSRVVGVADERLGQVVVACIVLKDGADTTAEGIRAFLRGRVAAYKIPKHVLFFAEAELPMTPSDTKVRDDLLLPLVIERLACMATATTTIPTT